jgi:hypothetical protein
MANKNKQVSLSTKPQILISESMSYKTIKNICEFLFWKNVLDSMHP